MFSCYLPCTPTTTLSSKHLSLAFFVVLNFPDGVWEKRNTHQSERWKQSEARPLHKIFTIGCPTFRQSAPLCLLVFARLHSGARFTHFTQGVAAPPPACRRQTEQRDAACSWWLMFGGCPAGGALFLRVKSGTLQDDWGKEIVFNRRGFHCIVCISIIMHIHNLKKGNIHTKQP